VATRVQEGLEDTETLGLDDAPRVHPFTPHAVAKLALALDDQDTGATLGHGLAEGRAAETATYDEEIVQNRLR